MTRHDKRGTGDHHLPTPEKRNAPFEQEAADSRDHDKQAGKRGDQKKTTKAPGAAPKKT